MTSLDIATTAAVYAWAERADPDCLSPAAEAELLRNAPWRRFAVLGDSVAAGIREPRPGYLDQSFADRVAAALAAGHPETRYRNLGAPWARLADVHSGQLPEAVGLVPDLVLFVAGGNDVVSPDYDVDRLWGDLLEILLPLADLGALVVTVGLFDLPRSSLAPRRFAAMANLLDRLDTVTAAVAAQVGGIHVDTHHHPRGTDPAIYSSDRLHANSSGHAIASAAIVRALAARLGNPTTATPEP
ncbi:SGNH/GDSL hydrolase family protein [Frankia sp. CNm7]|uniref:SGNH/GDSL hydrolase family protein n=1 Tax=Frankia nepalensis TaxID=1836974 RepID=A0A937R638_9ACTN|nr:SGNH/GDSL hydrolase family protein [Frankia nepalensis]MBL7501853.1 SGNH/GDSL hydrolase family protein [Frankia nepalensis]MBL7511695.1 SGNH/GDSL hydrolase family protein [Frankia nepalensis]MBL7519700.1 SGNH/GDSL hydrolase family protein [Frankia nepalensis]MBL7625941.1 SGNH/GDSL hydrolase family protein [Frankia nepalensis]